jgi:hypothetical protein
MAHFAKIGTGNKVTQVLVVSNDIALTEQAGVDFLNNLYNTRDVWKQTSYNTVGGVHLLGGTPLRKNYAGVGFQYDSSRDAFIPPKPYASWTLNESTCQWDSPTPKPDDSYVKKDGKTYIWNEAEQRWDEVV